MNDSYRSLSYWHDSFPGEIVPRDPLTGDQSTDVVIVGAGYTGLWTAYYLKKAQPNLDVAVVEAEIAGFGASGRNGGWCLGVLAGIESWLANPKHREGAQALQRAMFDTVDEVGRVSEAEEIACDYAKGGTIAAATAPSHVAVLTHRLEEFRSHGLGEDDYTWLEPEAASVRLGSATNLGGLYSPHCASINPFKLARRLADVVERMGVRIYEQSPVTSIADSTATTDSGSVRGRILVRATEGYTPRLKGHARKLIPAHSIMIATEPLPDSAWKEIGLAERETFGDARRTVIYGQRTADGRLAFGARGEYYYGSRIRDHFPAGDPVFRGVHRALIGLFPLLEDAQITHSWGGPLGVPRDWRPSVGINRKTGRAWAGGYVGEGVAASNLAGRTLSDLILEQDTELVTYPWVGKPFPAWEREPVRWAGIKAITALADSVDSAELNGGETPRLRSRVLRSFVG
jgi:glycine/D-amino acid oxidase-like deaminating enzyme